VLLLRECGYSHLSHQYQFCQATQTIIQMCLNLLLYTCNFRRELRGKQLEDGLVLHKVSARSKANKRFSRFALEPVQILAGGIDLMVASNGGELPLIRTRSQYDMTFMGSGVDVKPAVTSDGDGSSPIGENRTGEYKEVDGKVGGSGHDAVSTFGERNEEFLGLNALDLVNCCN